MSKISLPSIPKSADRDTTVFLQSLKKAVEGLSTKEKADLSAAAKGYVISLNKKTNSSLVDLIGSETDVGAILDKIQGSITESQLSIDLGARISKIENNETAISTEVQERVADMLLTNERIDSEVTRSQEAEAELLTQIDILLATTDSNLALITEETTARTGITDAHASRLNTLDAKTDTANAHIGTLQTVASDNTGAIATTKTELRAEFEAADLVNQAAIDLERTTRVNDYSALSSQINTIQATSDNNASSVQTQAAAIAGINTQLSATWSVKVDVNGVVGGIALGSDGDTVDFIVRASTFAIQGPSGSKSVPFIVYPDGEWIGGVWAAPGVYIDTAFVRRGSFDSLSALSANIGHFKSSETGARLEIQDGLLTVYDSEGRLRVKLGVW